jgi:hypothetical protein
VIVGAWHAEPLHNLPRPISLDYISATFFHLCKYGLNPHKNTLFLLLRVSALTQMQDGKGNLSRGAGFPSLNILILNNKLDRQIAGTLIAIIDEKFR